MVVYGTHNAVHDNHNDTVLIYVNGELFPRSEAKISVFDSGYLVGDGVWEALRLHDDVLVFLDAGTFGGLTPVVKVDGRIIGNGKPGAMTANLTELYDAEVHRAVLAAKGVS